MFEIQKCVQCNTSLKRHLASGDCHSYRSQSLAVSITTGEGGGGGGKHCFSRIKKVGKNIFLKKKIIIATEKRHRGSI